MKCVYLNLKTKTFPENCQHCKAARAATVQEIAEKVKKLKRYDFRGDLCDGDSGRCNADMLEDPTGEYIDFSDLWALLGEKPE